MTKKRILSLILCMFMLSVCFPVRRGYALTTGAAETDILVSLGIMDAEDIDAVGHPIKRIMLAKICSRMLNIPPFLDGRTVAITDIDDEEAYSYAALSVSMHLMELDKNGRFFPENTVSYAELIRAVLNICGYETAAEQKGGYPSGYFALASFADIGLKGKSADASVSIEEAAAVVVQALEADMLQCISVGEKMRYTANKGESLLDVVMNCRKVEGIITDNGISALYGESEIAENQILLNGERLDAGATDAQRFLGYKVTCYVSDDETGNMPVVLMVYAKPKQNERTNIYARDVISFLWKNGIVTVEYASESDSSVKKISASECAVIYNGKSAASPDVFQEKIFRGQGSLCYLEAGSSQSCLFIDLYDTVCAESISTEKKNIYDLYTDYVVELEPKTKDVSYEIYKNGENIKLTKIKPWDIIEVYKSEDSRGIFYKLVVSNETVRGTVTQSGDEEIKVGDNTVRLSESFREAQAAGKLRARVGDKITLYLDGHDMAAATQLLGSGEIYGYLRAMESKNNLSGELRCRVLMTDGNWASFELAEKVSFNGKRTDAEALAKDPLLFDGVKSIRQLIRFALNDNGEINVLNTAKTGISDTEFSLAFEGTTRHRLGGIIGGLYQVNANAPLFVVPQKGIGEEISSNEENYFVNKPTSYLSIADEKCEYYFLLYDVGRKYVPAAIVVETDNFGATTNIDGTTAKSLLVKSVTRACVNEEEVYKINGMSGGGPASYVLYDEKLESGWGYTLYPISDVHNPTLKKKATDLKAGDVICFVLNEKNEINGFYIMFSRGRNQEYFEKSNTGAEDIYANIFIGYGKVTGKTDDRIFFEAEEGKTRAFILNGTNIYRFHESSGALKSVDLGSVSKGDNVFVRSYYGSWMPTDIIIYE